MEIIIENNTDFDFDNKYNKIVEDVFSATLNELGYNKSFSISVLVTNNEEIQYLNNKHRKINKPTDVLSFPQYEKDEIVNLKHSSNLFLGDIVLSMEKAISQSTDYNHSLEREVAFLITHSILHLLGYDHLNPHEEDQMFSLQECILSSIGLSR